MCTAYLIVWCIKWCEGNQGSVPSVAVVTLNKEPLLVSLSKFDLKVVWSFSAAVIRSDFQGSGAPAQQLMLHSVNTGGFFILPSMF